MTTETATGEQSPEALAPADGDFAARVEYGREARRRTPRSSPRGLGAGIRSCPIRSR